MGRSSETEVQFVKLDRYTLHYVRDVGTEYSSEESSEITHRARKRIRDANPGDTIWVVWDYNTPLYDIVDAGMVSGTAEEAVRLLTERVEALERIPKAIEDTLIYLQGDRYAEVRAAFEMLLEKIAPPTTPAAPAPAKLSLAQMAPPKPKPTLEEMVAETMKPRQREGDPGTWSHCGNMREHPGHLHEVVFNEGPYKDVPCNGTTKVQAHAWRTRGVKISG